MDSTLRVSLRLSKITFGDFVTSFNPGNLFPCLKSKTLFPSLLSMLMPSRV